MVAFLTVLCAPPRSDVVTQQGSGLSEIAFIHALLRQSRTHSARRYHGPYLVVAQDDRGERDGPGGRSGGRAAKQNPGRPAAPRLGPPVAAAPRGHPPRL